MPETKLPNDNFAETSAILGLLSRIWSQELDAATLQAMRQAPLAAHWKAVGGQLPETDDEGTLEVLDVDYCQLLIGPKGHISPVQSVWVQDRFEGDAVASMNKYIEMLNGFQACSNFLDHVAVQLQFAGALYGMMSQTKKPLMQGLATAFAKDHLQWTFDFFGNVESKAESSFYRSASKISRQFLFGDDQ